MFKFLSVLFFSGVFCLHADSRTDNPAYQELDNLALAFDTDKGSDWHNYTEVYATYLSPLRKKAFKFLEIGIYEGNSVKLWENYFPYAELHFIDINFSQIKYFSEKAQYHLADQESYTDLKRVMDVTGGNFDVIIDDGGHTMNQQRISFTTLFPYLKSEGLYIIEDLHTSYWKEYGGNGSFMAPRSGPGTFVNLLKDLVDEVNYVGARTASANHRTIPAEIEKELNMYKRDIYSMHFYDSLCIIIKR